MAASRSLTLHIKNMAGDIQTLVLDVAEPTMSCVQEALYVLDPVTYPRSTTLFRISDLEEKGDEEKGQELVDEDVLCMLHRDMDVVTLISESYKDDYSQTVFYYRIELSVPYLKETLVSHCCIYKTELLNLDYKQMRFSYKPNNNIYHVGSCSPYPFLGASVSSKEQWVELRERIDNIVFDLMDKHGFGDDKYNANPCYYYRDEPYLCKCGSLILGKSRLSHEKTKKHLAFAM
jgi:hypothetical protein